MAEDCGCDGADEFAALADVADDDTPDLHPDPRGNTVRRWSGLIAPYGVPTGDGRRFAAGALTSRDLPAPMKWQRTDNQGHSTSVVVGRVDRIHYGEDGVEGEGIFFTPDPDVLPRLAEDAAEAYQLTKDKVIGPSVDLDAMEFHPIGDPDEFAAEDGKRPEIEVTKGRISAITLVPIPAFAEARPFALEDIDADAYAAAGETAITAAGVRQDMGMFAIAPDDHKWDVSAWLEAGDTTGALYEDNDIALFPVAEMVNGTMAIVPAAVADAISVLGFHAELIDLDEPVKDALKARLEELALECELPTPPWCEASNLVASADAPLRTVRPSAAFADPKLSKPTSLQFERLGDGNIRVYGHVADWRSCHIGFQDRCVTAPRSRTAYAHFHKGSVQTEKGVLATGKITIGGGHADTSLGFAAAARHYDEVSSCVADVRAGEDKYGIWVSGLLRPGVTQERIDELAASPLSGDWRRIGGNLEMIAALAVNVPGFGMAEDRRGALALVAAGAVMDTDMDAKMAKMKGKKKKGFLVKDPDKDGDDDGGYSLEDVADAVFARFLAAEREERELEDLVEAFAEESDDPTEFSSDFERKHHRGKGGRFDSVSQMINKITAKTGVKGEHDELYSPPPKNLGKGDYDELYRPPVKPGEGEPEHDYTPPHLLKGEHGSDTTLPGWKQKGRPSRRGKYAFDEDEAIAATLEADLFAIDQLSMVAAASVFE